MSTEERLQLTNGYRWWRWVTIPFAIIAFIGLLYWENVTNNIIVLLISILLFFLFYKARAIYFDSRNIYFVRGHDETIVPMRTVKSLKRSRGKLNGRRFWILTYEGDAAQEKKSRFFCNSMGSTIKKFKTNLQAQNPDVVIWDHPFFNH